MAEKAENAEKSKKRSNSFKARASIIDKELKNYPPGLREIFAGEDIAKEDCVAAPSSSGLSDVKDLEKFPFAMASRAIETTIAGLIDKCRKLKDVMEVEIRTRRSFESNFQEYRREVERSSREKDVTFQKRMENLSRSLEDKIVAQVQEIQNNSLQSRRDSEERIVALERKIEELEHNLGVETKLRKRALLSTGTQRNAITQSLEQLQMELLECKRENKDYKERIAELEQLHSDIAEAHEDSASANAAARKELSEKVDTSFRSISGALSKFQERLEDVDTRTSAERAKFEEKVSIIAQEWTKTMEGRIHSVQTKHDETSKEHSERMTRLDDARVETTRALDAMQRTLSSHSNLHAEHKSASTVGRGDVEKLRSTLKRQEEALRRAESDRTEQRARDRDRVDEEIQKLLEATQKQADNTQVNLREIRGITTKLAEGAAEDREAHRKLSENLADVKQSLIASSEAFATKKTQVLREELLGRVDDVISKLEEEIGRRMNSEKARKEIVESLFSKEQNAREHLEGVVAEANERVEVSFKESHVARETLKKELLGIMQAHSERERKALLERMAGELKEGEASRREMMSAIANKHSELTEKLSAEEKRREELKSHLQNQLKDKKNWTPDQLVHACQICNATFTFFKRKHHCRTCGGVICNDCSKWRNENSPGGSQLMRTCRSCFEEKTSKTKDEDSRFITPEAMKRAEGESRRQLIEIEEAKRRNGSTERGKTKKSSASSPPPPTPYIARALDPF